MNRRADGDRALERPERHRRPDPAIERVDRLMIERLKLSAETALTTTSKDARPSNGRVKKRSRRREDSIDKELKAERAAAAFPVEEEEIDPEDIFPLELLPSDAIIKIVEHLSFRERARLRMTCHRLNRIVLDKRAGACETLSVLNMFQKSVWDTAIKENQLNRFLLYKLPSKEQVESFFLHVDKVECMKIWYDDIAFVNGVLDILDETVQVKAIDIYPYGTELNLEKVAERFPKIHALTMRPHGNKFYDGLTIDSVPDFKHLFTLAMESFEPLPGFRFPPSIVNLEFSHRQLPNNESFFEPLQHLNLEFLSISHLKLHRSPHEINRLFQALSNMKKLSVVMLKFCHLDANVEDIGETELGIKQIQFDLCYDVSFSVMKNFITSSQSTLNSFSISILYEDEAQFANVLRLCPILEYYHICLSFSIMQKDSYKNTPIKDPPAIPDVIRNVLFRLDISYLSKPDLLHTIFQSRCKDLLECKFITTTGLTDSVLELLSKNCPNLRKLTIIKCTETTAKGLTWFVTNISTRQTSSALKILYKNNIPGVLVNVYGKLMLKATPDQDIRFTTKTFPGSGDTAGERLYFCSNKKTIIYKSYAPEDSNSLLGLVIDIEDELPTKDDVGALADSESEN